MMDLELKIFIKKYFLKYYIFGYTCILGFFLQASLTYLATKINNLPIRLIVFILVFIGSVLLLRKWLIITLLSKKKYHFFKQGYRMLSSGRFDKNYFLNGMFDPCFRIIVKDLLHEFGLDNEYSKLKIEAKIQKYPIYDNDETN